MMTKNNAVFALVHEICFAPYARTIRHFVFFFFFFFSTNLRMKCGYACVLIVSEQKKKSTTT